MTLRERIFQSISNIRSFISRLRQHQPVSNEPNLMLDEMGQPIAQKRPLMERLKDSYRLTVSNPETFEELGSFKLSLLSVYTAVASIAVFLTIMVVSLIVFTPLKSYIPGYGDAAQLGELQELSDKIDDMENQIKANQTYTDDFRKMLVQDVETVKEAPKEEVSTIPDSLLDVGTIEEEKQLREQYEKNKGVASIATGDGIPAARPVNYSPKEVSLEQLYFTAPITGEIIRGIKMNEQHYGVDIVAPKNTPIKAAMDGYIVMSDFTVETGNTITIQHSHGVVTSYKHCASLLKKQGVFVKAGEAIAIIGNTGTLTNGPHLHFELWHNGKCANPTDYINFN